jgi:probable rRNA maturation factor
MAITFTTEKKGFKLIDRRALRDWISRVATRHKKHCGNIHYVFVSDDQLLEMNQRFLNHNTYTDIITFDYTEENVIHGDIFISVDRVKDNADKFSTEFKDELHRVMIHGILHLCGLKDKTKKDTEKMREEENRSLSNRPF